MMKQIVLSILLLFFWSQGRAQNSSFNLQDGTIEDVSWKGNDVTFKVKRPDGKLVEFTFETKTIPKGTIHYHWTNENNVNRWNGQGHIDGGEVDFLRTPSGDRQVYGAGVYTSESALNSRSFGESLAAFEMPDDIKMITGVKAGGYGQSINSFNKAEMDILKRNGIHGHFATSNTGGNWWVFTDEVPFTKVRKASVDDFVKSADVKSLSEFDYLKDPKLMKQFPIGSHPALPGGDIMKLLKDPGKVKVLSKTQKQTLAKVILFGTPQSEAAKQFRHFLTDDIAFSTLVGWGTGKPGVFQQYYTITGRDLDPSSDFLKQKAPEYVELLSGKKLTDQSKRQILEGLKSANFEIQGLPPRLQQALLKEFRGDALNFFRAGTINMRGAVPQWNIRPAEISTQDQLFSGTIQTSKMNMASGKPGTLTPYAQDLLDSREFIDTHDLRRAMAQGNGEPWKLYDEPNKRPLIDRWREASTDTNKTLKQRHELLIGRSSNFRRERLIAGGEIDPGNGKKYYRVNETHKKVLETNPYLTLEVVDDPYRAKFGEKTYLIRHEYPNFATYEKFKGELSPGLVKELDDLKAAEGLASSSEKSKDLTAKIMEELTAKIEKSSLDPLKRYQLMMSVHPFDDFNGRSLRAHYKVKNGGKPLLLESFDDDLFMTPSELEHEASVGIIEHRNIRAAMEREVALHPDFPKLFDLPELWEEVPGLANNPIALKFKRSEEMKRLYQDPGVQKLIYEKDYVKLQGLIHENFFLFLDSLPDKERRAFLFKDIIQTNSPILTTNEKILRKLYDDLEVLAKTPKNTEDIAQWLAVQRLQNMSGPNQALIEEFLKKLDPNTRELYVKKYFTSDPNGDLSKLFDLDGQIDFLKKELKANFDEQTIRKVLMVYKKNPDPRFLDLLIGPDTPSGAAGLMLGKSDILKHNLSDTKKAELIVRAFSDDKSDSKKFQEWRKALEELKNIDSKDPAFMDAVKRFNSTVTNSSSKADYLMALGTVYDKTKDPKILATFMDFQSTDFSLQFRKFKVMKDMDLPDAVKAKYCLELLSRKDMGYDGREILDAFKRYVPADPAFGVEFRAFDATVVNPLKEWNGYMNEALKAYEAKVPAEHHLTPTYQKEEHIREARRLKEIEKELHETLRGIGKKGPEEIYAILAKITPEQMRSPYVQKVVMQHLLHEDPRVFDKAVELLDKTDIKTGATRSFLRRRLRTLTFVGTPDGTRVQDYRLSSLLQKTQKESVIAKYMPEFVADLTGDITVYNFKSKSEMRKISNKCKNMWSHLMNHPFKLIVGGFGALAGGFIYYVDPEFGKFIIKPFYSPKSWEKDLNSIDTKDEDRELEKTAW